MKVGFVGLGAMGFAMAQRVNMRYDLIVFNRTTSKAEALVANGARIAADMSDMNKCNVVGSMLSDDRAVEAIFLDGDQLKVPFQSNTIHMSHSTISSDLVNRLQRAHLKANVPFINAPVLGRPDKAAVGELIAVAAGPRPYFDAAKPVLDAFSVNQYWVGDAPSQAAITKLAVNFLVAASLESLAESFAMVRCAKIDPERFLSLLTETIFSAPVYHAYAPLVAREASPSPCFKTTLGLKDISLAQSEAHDLGANMPMATLIADQLQVAISAGFGDDDWSSLAKVAARNAGLQAVSDAIENHNRP